MKQDERCTRCGGEIFPNAGEQWPDGWIHSEPNNCYLTALARAEAAEAEAESAILVASDAAQREENAMHALAHFRARVAELESQAAQGWRPLDAPPAAPGEYLIGADYIPDVLLAEYHADTDMWYQQLPDGEWQLAGWPTHWRPLPPAPQERTP